MSINFGIRFKGIVKHEFRKTFGSIALEGGWIESLDPVFKKFGEIEDSIYCIPLREVDILPYEWQNEDVSINDSFKLSWNKESGYWIFQCFGYEWDLFEKFFEIIPYFIEELECLLVYCDCEYGISEYKMIDDKVICTRGFYF